jgi:hypothetical protein
MLGNFLTLRRIVVQVLDPNFETKMSGFGGFGGAPASTPSTGFSFGGSSAAPAFGAPATGGTLKN